MDSKLWYTSKQRRLHESGKLRKFVFTLGTMSCGRSWPVQCHFGNMAILGQIFICGVHEIAITSSMRKCIWKVRHEKSLTNFFRKNPQCGWWLGSLAAPHCRRFRHFFMGPSRTTKDFTWWWHCYVFKLIQRVAQQPLGARQFWSQDRRMLHRRVRASFCWPGGRSRYPWYHHELTNTWTIILRLRCYSVDLHDRKYDIL